MKNKLLPFIVCLLITSLSFGQTYKWAKNVGGQSDDIGTSIAIDSAGNTYTLGAFYGTADFDPGPGIYNLTTIGLGDAYLLKLDAAGNFVWAKKIGGSGYTVGQSVAVDKSGNVYTAGYFRGLADFDTDTSTYILSSYSSQLSDAFIAKYDTAGFLIWAKQFGAIGADHTNAIALDSSANIYAIGEFLYSVDFDASADTALLTSNGTTDIFILKLDSASNFIWAKNLGGASFDFGSAIALDKAGNIYCTGAFSAQADFDPSTSVYNLTPNGSDDAFVCKLSNTGDFMWAKSFGGVEEDWGNAIAIDSAANIAVTGYFRAIVDFNTGIDTLYKTTVGVEDIYISKLDSSGNFMWAQTFGSSSPDYGYGITTDAEGNIYTTGNFNGTIDFDPGINTDSLTANGQHDLFLSKLDRLGNAVWSHRIGGPNFDRGTSVKIGSGNKIYLTGWFQGLADFNMGAGTNNLVSAGSYDAFVLKMLQCTETYSSISPIACYSYLSPSGNNVWTSTGVYIDTIPNSGECDSIITIHLTIGTTTFSAITDTACGSYLSPSGQYTYNSSGVYSDTIPNVLGCDSIIELNITIHTIDVTVIDSVYQLSASANSAAYQWVNCATNYSNILGATSQTFTPSTSGNYAVIINENGCTDTSMCYNTAVITGVREYSFAPKIMPNPTNGAIIILFDKNEQGGVVKLTDLLGNVLQVQAIKNTKTEELIINGAAGMYLIDITTPEGKRSVSKILKN